MDATVAQACAYAGISRSTYYKLCDENEEFSDKMHQAQLWPSIVARHVIVQQILEGDGDLALKFLERREPELYSPRRRDEIENKYAHFSLEELDTEGRRLDAEIAVLQRGND